MRPDRTSAQAQARFAAVHAAHARDVLAYALRRADTPEDAADVVADTFLVAWRRLDDLPDGPDARLWLYGVARRTLANQRRGERRRLRLAERLRTELPPLSAAAQRPANTVDADLLRAIKALGEEDREVLLLTGWEDLSPAEVARVLDISRVAARSRLHRARKRLRDALAETADPADAVRRATNLELKEAR